MGDEVKKVLVVDDEPDSREYVQAVLEEDGFEFVTAGDGVAGIEKAKAEMPDLIILDVQMPKKDGFETFRELRSDDATKAIPVIMLTGVRERTGLGFDVAEMEEFLGSEPEAYVEKPLEPEKLREHACKLTGKPYSPSLY